MTIQMTITLENELYAKLKQLTGPRGMNQFISEDLWEKSRGLEQKRIESLMKEGYLATNANRAQLNED